MKKGNSSQPSKRSRILPGVPPETLSGQPGIIFRARAARHTAETANVQTPEDPREYGSTCQREKVLESEVAGCSATLTEQPGGTFLLRERNLLKNLSREGKLAEYAKRLNDPLPEVTAWTEQVLRNQTDGSLPGLIPQTNEELQTIVMGHKILVKFAVKIQGSDELWLNTVFLFCTLRHDTLRCSLQVQSWEA